jgi:hypothetical protein
MRGKGLLFSAIPILLYSYWLGSEVIATVLFTELFVETWTYYVAEAGLELGILLPQPPSGVFHSAQLPTILLLLFFSN